MAEIRVQAKKHQSNAWLWIIIALLVIGAVVYFLMRNETGSVPGINGANTSPTTWIAPVQSILQPLC